ncbi:hypothetical protein CEXT_142751 [Caerostris extrusa]|uniref:Uncharacterized protein n=1 Tax=Caerostris extrusa TaxID=172846 RepID=A0AAV4UKC4_CAEEX|nr:hypothetical protein CEXT_142751 [Caerostris extrusa]
MCLPGAETSSKQMSVPALMRRRRLFEEEILTVSENFSPGIARRHFHFRLVICIDKLRGGKEGMKCDLP